MSQEQKRLAIRRFDSDNVLQDLIHYVRSLPEVPEGALKVENVTTRPTILLDPKTHGHCSLYSLDLWPRAQVLVSSVGA